MQQEIHLDKRQIGEKEQLLLDDKQGNIWDISDIAGEITYKTSRIGKPSSLEFTLIKGSVFQNQKFSYENGYVVRYIHGNQGVFYGYIFSVDSGKDEKVKIKAYDQTRYLTANQTYQFVKATAADVIKRIATDFQLKTGDLKQPSYVIPHMLFDNKKLIDMICEALDRTLVYGGKNYIFYDDFGKLVLRDIEEVPYGFVIGDHSLLTDYSYTRSIDDQTYNKIKLYRDNKDTGKRDTFVHQDSSSIRRWGLLFLYQKADDGLNKGQIDNMLKTLMTLRNRETQKLKVDALGDFKVRAGSFVNIQIDELKINQYFLVDECTHKVQGGVHTMSLDLKVV
ncbi:hypothetical protein [Paenibacillus xylanexedens]|uniref:XkdQ/YqbQ family protein n=1 Tax=Paenibacillus xylanexedens TaxID=528191 RepID=UPI0011A1FD30|nr:hypothetical protein [Paenibacillus xylanexedens]